MEIQHRLEDVEGSFNTESGKLICVPWPKHGQVLLCFKSQPMNVAFANIKLHSADRYAEAVAVLDDATKLGNEIAARWNAIQSIRELMGLEMGASANDVVEELRNKLASTD